MSRSPAWRLAALLWIPLATWQCTRTDLPRVSGARLPEGVEGGRAPVELTVGWRNAFRSEVTWDAAWVFLKFRRGDGPWQHATIEPDSAAPARTDDIPAQVDGVPDRRGVFVSRATPGRGPVRWRRLRMVWDYRADGVTDGSDVELRGFGIGMVHVPEGAFTLGDGEAGNVRGHIRGWPGATPFPIASEASVPLGGSDSTRLGTSGGYGMYAAFPDDFSIDAPAQLPGRFPKGYAAFYVMKHEVTQGLYAAFLNTLDSVQQPARNPAVHDRRARPGLDRYTLTTAPPFHAAVPDRPMVYLTWMDAAALADWAALRPMTELEFEKAARGTAPAVPGEFAWGTAAIHARRYVITQTNAPRERLGRPVNGGGNAIYAATTGGVDCQSCLRGPANATAFADGTDYIAQGTSRYGVAHLSGNLAERVVTIGNATGRRFDGRHGDGQLNALGNAAGPEVANWPGSSNTGDRSHVIGSVGTGLRGGSWASPPANLRVSDREFAAMPHSRRDPTFGYRFARTRSY